MRRRLISAGAAGAVVAVCLAVAACGSSSRSDPSGTGGGSGSGSGGKTTLTVGYSPVFGFLNLMAAKNVQPPGVTVHYERFLNFNEMVSAINAGKIDLTEIGDTGAMLSFANNAPIRIVASTASNAAATGFLVGPKSTAHTVADLKGQTVSFNKVTNSYPMFLREITKYGLKQSDFKIVTFTDAGEEESAMISGKIASADSIQPGEAEEVLSKGARVLFSGQGLIQNYYPYVAPESTVKTKAAALAAFIKSLRSTVQWAAAHPAAHANLVAASLGVSKQAIEKGYAQGAKDLTPIDATYQANLQNILNFFEQQGVVQGKPDLSKLLDSQFNSSTFGSSQG